MVSLNLCTDQLLVMLAPEQVAGLSFLARDPVLSFVAPRAALLPVVRADAEAVLRLRPDLVLAGRYGAQTTLALLRSRGVRVAIFDEATDIPAIERQTLEVAALLGVRPRGEALVAGMRARLAALPHWVRGSALVWEPRGWTDGPASLGAAMLAAAGWTSVGSGRHVGLESLVAHPPDLLVTDPLPAMPSLATDLLAHPALRGLRRVAVPPALLICGGPYSVGAAELLSR